jgi:shikimate dehydrogenase
VVSTSSSVQPVLALLGLPVAGNPAQYMVEKALAHHGLDWRYLSVEVAPERLEDAVRGMRAMGFRGGNCSGPHQEAIGPLLDRLTQAAELTGVVNCIRREDDDLVGENTKGQGFVEALRRRIDPAGKRAVLLGAGRMGRAIAVELALARVAHLTVVDRSESAARELVERLSAGLSAAASFVAWEQTYGVPADTEVLVDATPAGDHPPSAPLPLDLERLGAEAVVADTSFDPPRTWLLKAVAPRGCPTLGGLEVFVEQAALDFRLWTGIDPDRTVLREAAEEFLGL